MNILDLCEANKALGIEVREFILNVPDAKEESITDYLVWKWRSLDKKFNYINVKTFNRHEENAKTGADFELELWLVGSKQCAWSWNEIQMVVPKRQPASTLRLDLDGSHHKSKLRRLLPSVINCKYLLNGDML